MVSRSCKIQLTGIRATRIHPWVMLVQWLQLLLKNCEPFRCRVLPAFLCWYLTTWNSGQQSGSIPRGSKNLHNRACKVSEASVRPGEEKYIHSEWKMFFLWLVMRHTRETGVGCTCMETCQGQEWGMASSPLTTLVATVLGFTAGFPQSAGQAGRDYVQLTIYN